MLSWGIRAFGGGFAIAVLGGIILGSAGGCNPASPAAFRLNLEGREPRRISFLQRESLEELMVELFGTPDEPRLPPGVELNLELLRMAAGPAIRMGDEEGYGRQRRGLYREHCARCHGISGDGAGPAALVLHPYPRDFRWGIFKYTSTLPGLKPTRADLRQVLRRGLPGTAMPSFARLDPIELEALVEYVIYLSIRGETERYAVQLILDEDEPLPLSIVSKERIIEEGAQWAYQQWLIPESDPQQYVVVPPPPPEVSMPAAWADSVAKGRELYRSERAQCVKCHGPEGAGDGEQTDLYDDWNLAKKGVTPAQTARLSALFSLPLQRLKARDFRAGIFHGGSRAEDLYLRIHIGIKGTPMPGVGPNGDNPGVLQLEEIWHIVHFIQDLAGQNPFSQKATGAAGRNPLLSELSGSTFGK